MESRLENIGRTLALLDNGFANLLSNCNQIHSKLSAIENLLTTVSSGKTSVEGRRDNLISQSANIKKNSLFQPVARALETPSTRKQVSIPKFNSIDLEGWIIHMEKYFEIYGTHDDMKVYKSFVQLGGTSSSMVASTSSKDSQYIFGHCLRMNC